MNGTSGASGASGAAWWSALRAYDTWVGLARQIAVPIGIYALAFVWVLLGPQAPLSPPLPHAFLSLTIITLVTAVLMRQVQTYYKLDRRAGLELPDPLYTLLLATLILAGGPGALILAAAAPMIGSLPEHFWAPHRRWSSQRLLDALHQSAASVAITGAASFVYVTIGTSFSPTLKTLHGHLAATILASIVMLIGVSILRITERRASAGSLIVATRAYLASPAARFQFLMLAIGPLLPLAELLDDIEAELAWMLFLLPLYAMYYLALVSMRLEQRTDELQQTVEELGASRRRQAELTGYAALITQAQEEERRRLARELHDDTAQALVALSRGLDTLAAVRGPARTEQDAKFLEELGLLAKRSVESIRRACQDLRPSVLDDLGLAAALESLASSMTQRGLPCSYTQLGEPCGYPPEIEVTIYRIAQEALTNALRHAGAHTTTMHLAYEPHRLSLSIQDDGHGFDPAQVARRTRASLAPGEPEPRSGLGLLGMRERAALIGATLDITAISAADDAEHHGTTVSLTVPVGDL